MVAVVGFAGRVNHVVFVKAGVFSEALFTAGDCADVRFLPLETEESNQFFIRG